MNSPQGFLRHIQNCTRFDPTKFVRFIINNQNLGWITHGTAKLLPQTDPAFIPATEGIKLDSSLDNFSSRNALLARAAAYLSHHHNTPLCGEMYPIIQDWGDEPLAQLDRTAMPWFGTRGFGVHVNGFVHKPEGLYLWIGERAADRRIDPGKLDCLIGGGMSIGYSLQQTLTKEAWEEAGIPDNLVANARTVGSVSYKVEMMKGVRNDKLFLYDLELPESFTPRNTDGEVSQFYLMPLGEVAAIIHDTDRFKFNCNLVIIDFLIRHGFITPSHTEYTALTAAIKPLQLTVK